MLGNGHIIKLSYEPEHDDIRFQNFEPEFQRPDSNFPSIIAWLSDLDRKGPPFEIALERRMLVQPATDAQFADLIECVMSLAVRSPMHRQQAVSLAEHIRGPLPERERNVLIGSNMRYSLRNALKSLGGHGKIAVIFSAEKEFIFGDGFFNNIIPQVQHQIIHAKLCVPITPWLAVLFTRPRSYHSEPRLVTLAAGAAEVDAINHSVQVYSRRQLFYRSEKPDVVDAYASETLARYTDDRNPIDSLIYRLPGIPSRDTTFDFFRDNFGT